MTVVLIVAIVLLAFWLLGLATRFTGSGLIHIALVVALVLLVVWLLRVVMRVF